MSRKSSYMTRALRHPRPVYARILSRLGYVPHVVPEPAGETPPTVEVDEGELRDLRAEYQDVVGKRAYHGWTADELRDKIAAAKAAPAEGEDD